MPECRAVPRKEERGTEIMLTYAQKRYLCAIYKLGRNGGEVRSAEVSKLVGVSKASTVKMTHRLIDDGYIDKEYYGRITLTEKGIKVANELFTQCLVLEDFLRRRVGVGRTSAEDDAVSIVARASDETVDKLVGYILAEAHNG